MLCWHVGTLSAITNSRNGHISTRYDQPPERRLVSVSVRQQILFHEMSGDERLCPALGADMLLANCVAFQAERPHPYE
jgi:hypothetical protein